MNLPLTGTCQCGDVRYQVNEEPIVTTVCHCLDCQKLSASAFSITMLIKADAFELLSGNLSQFERPADKGGTAICWFCFRCGNRVYHENPQLPGFYRLKPGGLDDLSVIRPQVHVWTSRAQDWVPIPTDIPTFDTQPDLREFLVERGALQDSVSSG